MEKTKYFSWKNGKLCRGCKLCVKGSKLVLFITGICGRKCWYCSLSDKKKDKDVIYANERLCSNIKEVIEESKLCSAEGAGITGGDPLRKLNRTIKYIKSLKKEFGSKFHIHLYTSLDLVSESSLKKLFNSGLDEIRFHLDITNNQLWDKLKLAKKFRWKVGVEIPVIPNLKKEIIKLIEFIKDKVDFLNLNELEISELSFDNFEKRNFKIKNDLSYSIKGSEELSLELLKLFPLMNIHYCSSKLKDAVQLSNRIKKRAKNIKEKFDIVTSEGLLIRGVVKLGKSKDSLEKAKAKIGLKVLKNQRFLGHQNKKQNFDEIKIDKKKNRLLLSKKNVIKFAKKIKKLGYTPCIVEEYPTWDGLEVEIEFL